MGNCDCKIEDAGNQYSGKLWVVRQYLNHSCIIRSIFNDSLQFQKWFSNQEENQNLYYWRNFQKSSSLPQINHFQKVKAQSEKYQKAKYIIITEIMSSLRKFKTFNHQEIIILMKNIFEGLSILVPTFGYFLITEENIYLTKNGQTIIWINHNLASNKVENPIKHYILEEQFVHQVIQIIQSKNNCPNSLNKFPTMKIKQALLYFNNILQQCYPNSKKTILDNTKEYNLNSLIKRNLNQHSRKQSEYTKPYFVDSKTTGIMTNGISNSNMSQQVMCSQKNIPARLKNKQKQRIDPDQLLEELIRSQNIHF